MMNFALAVALVLQLTAPGNSLPQVMSPSYKADAPVHVGRKSSVTVSFSALKGYTINREQPISLVLTAVPGMKLDKMEFKTSKNDPKSKDEYYVDLPTIKVPVTAAKAGKYEIPGKLTYFFCSKADGFCSRQAFEIKIPVQVQ